MQAKQHTAASVAAGLQPTHACLDSSASLLPQRNTHMVLLQVYNKWADDSDSLVASGALPLQQVLQLSQVDHPATAEAGPCSHTFLVQLQLLQGSGEAAVQQQGVAVLLQVTVSYFAENCYSLEDGDELLQQQEEEEEEQQQQQQQQHPGSDCGIIMQEGAVADQWREAATGSTAAAADDNDTNKKIKPHGDSSSSRSSSRSSSLGASDNELVSALRPDPLAAADAAAAAAAAWPLPAAAEQAVSAAAAPAEPLLLQAALCVEVVRACGLQVRPPHLTP
jgi:hypothetical protein